MIITKEGFSECNNTGKEIRVVWRKFSKEGFSECNNTGKEIRVVWRNFFTLQRRNKLKLDKRKTILHQIQYIIIFDFFYADHSILKPDVATQYNILNLGLAAIQITFKSRVGRGKI